LDYLRTGGLFCHLQGFAYVFQKLCRVGRH
jgi:hypothetical protein